MRSPLWTGILAFLFTILTGGIWTALLLVNLRSPTIPWAAAAMAVILWAIWSRLPARKHLRALRVSARTFTLALAAGALSIASLTGLWIVLYRAVKIAGNPVPDFSQYPLTFAIPILIMASLVSSIAEESGFRGYFQSTLETRFSAASAIAIQALVIAPAHGLTQGFAWPTMLFYLLVDTMLGITANLTKSILPGIAIHSLGLLTFFAIIWPQDHNRLPLSKTGPDQWFCIHLAQTLVFGALSIYAYTRLAKHASPSK